MVGVNQHGYMCAEELKLVAEMHAYKCWYNNQMKHTDEHVCTFTKFSGQLPPLFRLPFNLLKTAHKHYPTCATYGIDVVAVSYLTA